MTIANTNLPEHQLLLGAALFLMTQYAHSRCPGVCRAVAQHFTWLARHPAQDITPEQRRLYRRLAIQWAEMAAMRNVHRSTQDVWAGVDTYLQ